MELALRAARVKSGLTQEQVAKSLGISRETVGKWENGKTFPNVAQIKKLEALYRVGVIPMDDNNTINMTVKLDTSEAEAAIERLKGKLLELADVMKEANSLRHELASGEIDLNLSVGVDS